MFLCCGRSVFQESQQQKSRPKKGILFPGPAIARRCRGAGYHRCTVRSVTAISRIPSKLITNSVWLALVLTLINRLRPTTPPGSLQDITNAWRNPVDSTRLLTPWPEDFGRDISPKPCHSHNDYWRKVPLYDALAAGCTGIEADIWLPETPDRTGLRVGHRRSSLNNDRTLSSLYIQPLATMLHNLNAPGGEVIGLFETIPTKPSPWSSTSNPSAPSSGRY